MKVNPIMPRDYNSDSWAPPDRMVCAGYDNKKMSVDYAPRDKRVWLRACRDKNCPDDRCLDMIEDLVDE